jgi:hypothetical protein
MGFTTAEITFQEEPALYRFSELVRLIIGQFDRISLVFTDPNAPPRLEIVESQMAQLIQIAERIQTPVHLLADLSLAAGTGLELTKVRMPDWNLSAQIAQTLAVGAIGIT